MKFCLIIAISLAFVATSMAKCVKAPDQADRPPMGCRGIFGDQEKKDDNIARLTAQNLAEDSNTEENKDFLPYFLFNTLKTAMKQSGDNEKEENKDFYTFPGFQ